MNKDEEQDFAERLAQLALILSQAAVLAERLAIAFNEAAANGKDLADHFRHGGTPG